MPCYHCGKGVLYGRSHTHHRGVAGGRWKKRAPKTQRIFHPNLQRMSIIEDGEEVRIKLCTKCLKRVKMDIDEGVRPFLQLAQYQVKSQMSKPKTEIQKVELKAEVKSVKSKAKKTSKKI